MNAYDIAGRIIPAKTAKLELIDHLKEIRSANYQTDNLRISIPRRAMDRAIADLEHGVQLLDALCDERDKNAAAEFAARQQPSTWTITCRNKWSERLSFAWALLFQWPEQAR